MVIMKYRLYFIMGAIIAIHFFLLFTNTSPQKYKQRKCLAVTVIPGANV